MMISHIFPVSSFGNPFFGLIPVLGIHVGKTISVHVYFTTSTHLRIVTPCNETWPGETHVFWKAILSSGERRERFGVTDIHIPYQLEPHKAVAEVSKTENL